MKPSRGLVVPESWVLEAQKHAFDLKLIEPTYFLIPIPGYEGYTRTQLKKKITTTLRQYPVRSAVVVLPACYASSSHVPYWPEMIVKHKSSVIITSVLFADNRTQCMAVISAWLQSGQNAIKTIHATCQYEAPYPEILRKWNGLGATCYHPGDFFKHEFLDALQKMKGHWLYWGHANSGCLNAYNDLTTDDILTHKPAQPLQSTLWFSCATLESSQEQNIAIEWFKSGATFCLLASMGSIQTQGNQALILKWIELCQEKKATHLADIIHQLVVHNRAQIEPILAQYRLIGLPWVSFL